MLLLGVCAGVGVGDVGVVELGAVVACGGDGGDCLCVVFVVWGG